MFIKTWLIKRVSLYFTEDKEMDFKPPISMKSATINSIQSLLLNQLQGWYSEATQLKLGMAQTNTNQIKMHLYSQSQNKPNSKEEGMAS
mgnify:CR=1 FL=1